MNTRFFILAFILLSSIKGKDESTLKSFSQLNTIETIIANQSFIINTTEASIAFFDSFDTMGLVYISKDINEFLSQKDERVTGKFIEIEPNVEYYVRIRLIMNGLSNLRKYLYPKDIPEEKISIKENELNFIYLQKDKTYTFDFSENIIAKRVIKLSRKTLESKIVINTDKELNKENLYYQMEENFKGELKLEVKENNAFIEFLSSEGDYDKLNGVSLSNYKILNETNVIKVEKTEKDFFIRLSSNKSFNFSFCYGLSNNHDYFYNNIATKLRPSKRDDSYIIQLRLYVPFKNIILTQNEFLSFTVKIEKESEQEVFITYLQDSPISPLLDEKLDKNYCEKIINNLINMFDLYIFTDIAKNPPNVGIDNYHHRKIDIKKELANVKTEGRYFYEFYQEVMSIIYTLKDYHLTLYATSTPKGIPFVQYQISLPFNLIIHEDENKEFKLYIKLNDNIKYYDDETKNILKNCENVPIKTINDKEPFDFVQGFSKFESTKNVHAQFTLTLNYVFSRFNLALSPFSYSEFVFYDYEFENNIIIRLPTVQRTPNLEDLEFNKFYEEYIISKEKKIESKFFFIPSFEEVQEKYLEYKGLKKKEIKLKNNEEKIEWKITIKDPEDEEGYMKCRVDTENEVNVVLQTSFHFDYYLGILKIFKCAELFHTNDYPIIIIESLNGGGVAQLYMTMHQLFQMRTVDRTYFSFRMTDISRDLDAGQGFDRTDAKTCRRITSFDDFKETTDHYNYNGEDIEHIRSEAMDLLPFYFRNIFRDYREKNKENENLKRPTDIIIFTDSFSYSATSGLIKGFQNTGGAIIVGYYGNPKIKGIDLFDGSQSISSVRTIENLQVYKNLEEIGFHIVQVTVGESFDDSVYGSNPIPREYTFEPVDDRVDIYSKYSDDLYQKFIEQGKAIYEKFNKGNYCNPKNEKLLLHNSECTIEKEHAHGGYRCKSDKNEWNTEDCQAYYCDIGYYYNQYYQECLEECSFNDTKSYLIIDDMKDKVYEIENNITTTFTFINEYEGDYYFFKSSEDLINGVPKIGFIRTGTLFVNPNKDAEKNFEFKITKLNTDYQFSIFEYRSIRVNSIELLNGKTLMILHLYIDHIFYGYNMLNSKANKFKYAVYKDEMTLEDILNGNDKYFKEYTNENDFISLPKNEINLLLMNYSDIDQVHYVINSKEVNENISIVGEGTNFLFLPQNKIYVLDFKDNTINRIIKLSRKTLKAEINILNETDENIATLKSDNIYYIINQDFKGKLKLEIKNSDAIIEFLFKLDGLNSMNFNPNLKLNVVGKYTLIRVEKEYFGKKLKFKIQGEPGKSLKLSMFLGYSIPPYSYYYPGNLNQLPSSTNEINFDLFVDDIKLMEKENYCILFENSGPYLNFTFSEDNTPEREEEGGKGEEGLETWVIAIIVVGSILAVIIIIVLVVFCLRKNRQLTSDRIEEKMENLTEIK